MTSVTAESTIETASLTSAARVTSLAVDGGTRGAVARVKLGGPMFPLTDCAITFDPCNPGSRNNQGWPFGSRC